MVSLATDADDGVVPSVADCVVLNVVDTSLLLVVDAGVVDNVVSVDDDAVDVCSLLSLVVASVLPVDNVVDPSSVVDKLLVLDEDVVVSDDDCVALVTVVVVSVLINGGAVAVKLLP